jgi:outer membrane protein TolC
VGGCTSLKDYIHNGFKVGPNYATPPAPVAEHWIDEADKRVRTESDDLSRWWTVFKDPVLNALIAEAYSQNLTLREAAYRVLAARAQLGIAVGELFPQSQNAIGTFTRSGGPAMGYSSRWALDFNLNWELDFWGRLRRAVAAQEDLLDASVEDYDDVLVTLLAGVASSYVQIRTDQQRIVLLDKNVRLQEAVLDVVRRQFEAGIVTDFELYQAISNLRQTQAQIPQQEIDLRIAMDQLCILLGRPPEELRKTLGLWRSEDERTAEQLRTATTALETMLKKGTLTRAQDMAEVDRLWKTIGNVYIPTAPTSVAVGIPADLLRRRPDVRRAERQAAAQGEQIGIAEAALYPAFSINGTLALSAAKFSHLFSSQAFNGSVGPTFTWELLNYGRLVNNIRFQDATFQELVLAYQQSVLTANQEVEDGLATFLQNQERARLLAESVEAGQRAAIVSLRQYFEGKTMFLQYVVIEQALVQQDDLWAQARGQIAQGLIQVYRALGGGWQIRLEPEEATTALPAVAPVNPPEPQEGRSEAGDTAPPRLLGDSRASAAKAAANPGTRAATKSTAAATPPESGGWSRKKDPSRPLE